MKKKPEDKEYAFVMECRVCGRTWLINLADYEEHEEDGGLPRCECGEHPFDNSVKWHGLTSPHLKGILFVFGVGTA